jgi:CO/xanthine dehydrogenase Mo-binding subunit
MAPDGSVLLRSGAADMGQGTRTALAQLAAEALGVELPAVRLLGPDTATTPDAGAAVGSRQVYVSGNAVLDAARPIRETLLDVAHEQTGLPRELLALRDGVLHAEEEPISLTVAELAALAAAQNRPLHGEGFYAMQYPPEFPADGYPYAHEVFTFGTQVAQVLVDVETGAVQVERLTVVQDAGRVVNPQAARGQVEGGAAMGVGYALLEELRVDSGRIVNDSLASYLVPTILDVPEIAVEILEFPEPGAPFGAKGIGEATVTPVAPAVANAVADAIGAPVNRLPLAPETVLAAMTSGGASARNAGRADVGDRAAGDATLSPRRSG